IGAYWGRGKRVGVYGGYLLACYDPGHEEYQTVCKIGTGFSDEDLKAHHAQLSPHVIASRKSYYRHGATSTDASNAPNVWFEPHVVWEVKAADLSLSPIYQAAVGQVDPNRGVSLRFPRFIREREDKGAEEATTSEQIAEMYRNQAVVVGNSGKGGEGEG